MEVVTKIAPIALALIMLGLGLGLTGRDFLRVINNPKDFIIGFFCQLILLPIVAFIIVLILDLPIEIAVGVMIIAAAPGGVTSNVMTKFANGDVALSISLTAITSLISIVSVPYVVFLSIELFDITYVKKEVSMLSISLKMFLVVTVPVLIGMIIRKLADNFIVNNMKIINKISIGLFCIVFIAIYIEEWDSIVMFLEKAGMIAFTLNVTMMIVAFYIAKFFATGVAQRRCISLEAGLQNGTLAVFVGIQLFGNDMIYMVPTAAYALIMMITSIIFVFILRKQT